MSNDANGILSVAERGSWSPCPILFGQAIFPFSPVCYPPEHPSQPGQPVNAHQVALEVGDEVYAFEQFIPATQPASVWFRGYVVSTIRDGTLLAQNSADDALRSFADDSQVFVGIWPANHCQIREQLDEADGRVAAMQARASIAAPSKSLRARGMSVVQEEDEDMGMGLNALAASPKLGHFELSTAVKLAGPDGRRLTSVNRSSATMETQRQPRPDPPLPSLKSGDETEAGVAEPLVDEIACAIREWSSLLPLYIVRRQYGLFTLTTAHIDALHAGRRKLLLGTLGAAEATGLRRELTARLNKANKAQGLDVLVRHPITGALVEQELLGSDTPSPAVSVSPARMFSMQVDLAYEDASTLLGQADHAAPALEASIASQAMERARMHHVFVELRALVASFCTAGETAELSFSLFNKSDSRFLTEDFCVIVDQHGNPGVNGKATLFIDLRAQEVQDSLYLVCRVVKNGGLKSTAALLGTGPTSPNPNAFDSARSSMIGDNSENGLTTMLHPISGGRSSVRRPFGCAVLDLSQLVTADGQPSGAEVDKPMPIFVSTSEHTYSSLHEDIINSRTREFEKSARADSVVVRVGSFHGSVDDVVRSHISLLQRAPQTQRLGLSDVAEPDHVRNDVYIKLWSGDFSSSSRGAAGQGSRSVEVTVEARRSDGAIMTGALSRGANEHALSRYTSMVFRSNNTPTYGELFKLTLPTKGAEQCHLFLTFRHRSTKDLRAAREAAEAPFAFAYLPLFASGSSFIQDGAHSLVLYRYDPLATSPATYGECPARFPAGGIQPDVPPSLARTMSITRDSMIIRTFLCSTLYTQNEVLLRLFNYETALLPESELLVSTLQQLRYCSEAEIVKHLRLILDALFGILASSKNNSQELSDLVFGDLIAILAIIQDRRFTNFRPVLEAYISTHFGSSTVHIHLLRSLQALLSKREDPESAQLLRSALKVWDWLFRLVLRSREIQRERDVGMEVTHDHVESAFRKEVSGVLGAVNGLLKATAPASIIGTQVLAIQNFSSILPSLSRIFAEAEVVDAVVAFCDAMPAATSRGKPAIWKLVIFVQLAKSPLFESAASRTTLVPYIVRWTKPFLAKFDERTATGSKETEASRDNARIAWLEANRLAVAVIATLSDRLHVALLDSTVRVSRTLLGQEQDNVEYVLNLLPRLVEVFREFENQANLAVIERQRGLAASRPVAFPSSYPFMLLTLPSPSAADRPVVPLRTASQEGRALLRIPAAETAIVILSLLHTAPQKILANFLLAAFEVEGQDNFGRFLNSLFRFVLSTLDGAAWPKSWLNVNIFAHTVALKLAEPVSDLLVQHFIPPLQSAQTFNLSLWRDYLTMILRLLASDQLVIEQFSPQKRRAVWRLAGDLRGRGAKMLSRLWSALSLEASTAGSEQPLTGGYQVQLGSSLVPAALELCLSHHDELRANAVDMLYSLIMNEWTLSGDFAGIQGDIIDRLDRLFSTKRQDDVSVSQALFVGQLRLLFDRAILPDELRLAVNGFINAVSEFLDLLLGIRNLPAGEEWTDDRIIGTLKLMSFVRGVTASPIFVRYIDQIKSYHVASKHFAEAGLTLKLHADLYTWDVASFLDAMPDAQLPRQSHFARKEALFLQIIDLLHQGRAYETAISLCKELQERYEHHTYSYQKLADVLARQSVLCSKIAGETRVFPLYFRVCFFGRGFPPSVQGKQFVYIGNELERLPAFCERVQSKHPKAILLRTNTPPDSSVVNAEGQYIQITAVTPEPDRTSPIFANVDVPSSVKAYYEANDTNLFSFARSYQKEVEQSIAQVSYAMLNRWVEKTVLVCRESFPAVLRRSEVTEVRLFDQSPIELALLDVNSRSNELAGLERRYLLASQVQDAQINTNVLSATLTSAVDTGDAGVPLYRRVFFSPEYAAANPGEEAKELLQQLRDAIDEQYRAIERCMVLHKALCPSDMRPFHDTLERFLQQNFAEEQSRLPPQLFPPEGMTFRQPSTAVRIADSTLSPTPSLDLPPRGVNGRSRAGSSVTNGSRNGAVSPQPSSSGLQALPEDHDRPVTPSHAGLNGHTPRFSESLMAQDSLRAQTRSPVNMLSRSPSEKASSRLSLLGSRIGDTLRRKRSAA